MQTTQKTVGKKSVRNGVRMQHSPPTWRKQFNAVQWIVSYQLHRDQQSSQHRRRQKDQRRDEVEFDNPLIDKILMRFMVERDCS